MRMLILDNMLQEALQSLGKYKVNMLCQLGFALTCACVGF